MKIRSITRGTPRWVIVSALIALVVMVLFVIAMLTGGPAGGGHGPSRHSSLAAVASAQQP